MIKLSADVTVVSTQGHRVWNMQTWWHGDDDNRQKLVMTTFWIQILADTAILMGIDYGL